MGVKYDVIFKDGARLPREAVCFGSMAGASWSFNNAELCSRPASEQAMIQFYTANNIHPIWEEPDFTKNRRDWSRQNAIAEGKRNANKAFLAEMKILFADLPWLSDVITLHPLVGVARAHIKQHAADKIITSLFLIRNLCNYGETAASYRHFRHMGLRPRICAVMASYMTKNFGAMGRCDFSQSYLGEYNWTNPQTFGKQAFIRMMTADKDTEFDFIQLPWAVQRGYRRDGFYRHGTSGNVSGPVDEDDYTPEEGGFKIFDRRYTRAERWDYSANRTMHPQDSSVRHRCSHLYTRNLVDCYSIPGDEPIEPAMAWNPVQGMDIFGHPGSLGRSTTETVDVLVAELERICMEAGVPSRFEV